MLHLKQSMQHNGAAAAAAAAAASANAAVAAAADPFKAHDGPFPKGKSMAEPSKVLSASMFPSHKSSCVFISVMLDDGRDCCNAALPLA